MMKVLVNAYAISPDRGSEPGMGWNWCIHLAEACELFIITEGEFRDEIQRSLKNHPLAERMHFYYLPVSQRIRRMCWNQGDWRFYVHYAGWQRRALDLARLICKEHEIDIIHQLNMVGFREPGFLWKIQGPKFIWGPIGGMALTPVQYFREAPWIERILIRCKNLFNRIQRKYSSRVACAIRKANVVLCATKEDFDIVSRFHHGQTVLINETGTNDFCEPVVRTHSEIHLIWVGKFMYRKQLALALRILSYLKDPSLVLDVVGSGSSQEEAFYHALAVSLGVEDQVVWHGQVPHDQVEALMDEADIFLFTSVSEATSTVTMEAISHGLPVICFDTCGFGLVVEEDMGIKIPLGSPEVSVRLFASAVKLLSENAELRSKMSQACYQKAPKLSWEAKMQLVLNLYREALSA